MRIRVALAEERTRKSNPNKKTTPKPNQGKPSTLILSADNDEEREILHTLYQDIYSRLSGMVGHTIKPIPFQESEETPNEGTS